LADTSAIFGNMTIDELRYLRESEDKVEFKEAKKNFPFSGGSHSNPHDRWKCVLGYCVALANEGGGLLVFGMTDIVPHQVVGTEFSLNKIGALEDEIYARLGIRVRVQEFFETGTNLRVLVFDIPGRPTRRVMRFEGVPLMRTGESLRLMSEDELQRIYSEQESDFSIKPCKAFALDDIDDRAIVILKRAYSNTQQNEGFSRLPDEQILSDLGLMLPDGTLTNAALVLLGKPEALERILPPARIMIEYRINEGQIHFDKREVIRESIFLAIESAWNFIDSYNGEVPVRVGSRVIRVPFFDKKVIREALLNAIAHRNYAMNSEIIVKLSPQKIIFMNPGGFPPGVTLENLIKVISTPRSALLTEILLKTGYVERSGQGVDMIFSQQLSEGKPEPDYSGSDYYQVSLELSGKIESEPFFLFMRDELHRRKDTGERQLSAFDTITLSNIRLGKHIGLDSKVLDTLLQEELIKKMGPSNSNRYTLSDAYFAYEKSIMGDIGGYSQLNIEKVAALLFKNDSCKISDFADALGDSLTRKQVRTLIDKLIDVDILTREGVAKGTVYRLKLHSRDKLFEEIVDRLKIPDDED
jgi:ATP-dependent DNA helicase RecG